MIRSGMCQRFPEPVHTSRGRQAGRVLLRATTSGGLQTCRTLYFGQDFKVAIHFRSRLQATT